MFFYQAITQAFFSYSVIVMLLWTKLLETFKNINGGEEKSWNSLTDGAMFGRNSFRLDLSKDLSYHTLLMS